MMEKKIHLGDCIELLKNVQDKSVDLVITDPPYGMSFRSNFRKERYGSIKQDDNLDWLPEIAKELFRVLKENSQIYVFCSKHNIDVFLSELKKYFSLKNVLIWEKNNTSMGDLSGAYADKTEFILFMSKGKSTLRGRRDDNILKFDRTGNILHPTQKPTDLIRYLIEKSSDLGMVVLDPFMGSGSTPLACKESGREYIAMEIEEKYFDVAKKRLNQGSLSSFTEQLTEVRHSSQD